MAARATTSFNAKKMFDIAGEGGWAGSHERGDAFDWGATVVRPLWKRGSIRRARASSPRNPPPQARPC